MTWSTSRRLDQTSLNLFGGLVRIPLVYSLIMSRMSHLFSNVSTIRDCDLNNKATGGCYVSKLTLFTLYFQRCFTNGFQTWKYDMVTVDKILDVSNFDDRSLNNKVTRGHYASQLTLFTLCFQKFTSGFHTWIYTGDPVQNRPHIN